MGIRIFLVDDEGFARDYLRLLLRKQPDFTIIGEAANGREAVDKIVQCRPDVAILDLIMPELNGLAATQHIRTLCPTTQVIIFSMYADSDPIQQVFWAGASGYVLKEASGSEIVHAIRMVHSGQCYLSRNIVSLVQKGYITLPEWVGNSGMWV